MIYQGVGQINGSVSAEHGIGILKRDFLHYSIAPETLAVMKQLKYTFDPNNILNPEKIFI